MTTCKRGDVVLVPFPFSDLSNIKRRPALVISTEQYNEASGDVVIAQITSNTAARPLPGDLRVSRWQQAGLLKPSLVRARLTTIQSGLLLRVLGNMPADEMRAVDESLAIALGLRNLSSD